MAQATFPISTVVVVQVSSPAPGLQGQNTGNLALFTTEPANNTFPAAGIQYYQSPVQVATDFGTASRTYAMAVRVFSQQPNILLPGGQLIIIKMTTSQTTLTLSGVPASGSFELVLPAYGPYAGGTTVAINWNDTLSQMTAKIQAVSGYAGVTAKSGSLAGESVVLQMDGVYGEAPTLPTVAANSLQTGGSVSITVTPSKTATGQSVADAINANINLTSFFGMMVNETVETIGQTDFLAAAAIVQTEDFVWGVVGTADTDNTTNGSFLLNQAAANTQTRTLTYLDASSSGLNALDYLAGYMGRGLSVDYTGSKTAITMNGKEFNSVLVDSVIQPGANMTHAADAGSDVYIAIGTQGNNTPFNISNGANLFFDEVTGRLWLANALQTAYFNALAQTNTQIPTTESGMNVVKDALKAVMQQGVDNGYLAGPGATWTSPDTFGNITAFFNNIAALGFYIFSNPVSGLTATQILQRQAPLVQIAYVEANPIHKASVLVNVVP